MKGFLRKAYTLPPMAVSTISFDGVTPNYFRVNNGGNAQIYAGIVNLPTPKLYDFKIEPNQVRMYCTDKGYPNLYLYNASGSPADVIVTSFIEVFSPEVLAFSDFNIAENEEQVLNVEIGGFTDSLPTGQNHIGEVSVNELPQAHYTALEAIKNACSNIKLEGDIGEVNVDMTSTNDIIGAGNTLTETSNTLLGTGNTLKESTNTLLGTINEKLDTLISNSGETHLYSHNGTISYGEYWSMNKDIREVVFVTNDGEEEINLVLFDGGEAIEIKVKGGETLNHITGKFTTIGVDTAIHSVTIPYRVVYKYV